MTLMSLRTIDDVLAEARAGLRRMSPVDAYVAQQRGAVLVDIRPEAQRRREGEIPGAIIIERNVLEWRLDPSSSAALPIASYDLEVVVLCSEGFTSSLAAAALQELGIDATDLEGGFVAWQAAGLPTTGDKLLSVDVESWEVRVAGELLHATPQEFRVLAALTEAHGRVVPRETLARLIDAYPSTTRALDVHVCRLRAKLGAAAPLLVTVRGVGWRLLSE